MRTETINLYSFTELSEKAKETVLENYRSSGVDYVWMDEYKDSLSAFADYFGVKIKDYSISTCSYSYIKCDAENGNFRGKKLSSFDRDYIPTGFCADCDLWMSFYDSFKQSGDAKSAFDDAIDSFVKAWVNDMEHQESDEYIIENIEANEYEFTENGSLA